MIIDYMDEIIKMYSDFSIGIWENSKQLPSIFEKQIMQANRRNLSECRQIVLHLVDIDAQYEQFDITDDFSMYLLSDLTLWLFGSFHHKYFRFPNSNLKKLDRHLVEIYNGINENLRIFYQ